MLKSFLFPSLLFLMSLTLSLGAPAQDIPTHNKGEQAMIQSIRTAIDQATNLPLVRVGAGQSGAQAFQKPSPAGVTSLLVSWQWLERMDTLAPGTVVVLPEHALDEHAQEVVRKNKLHLILIEGVLHGRRFATLSQEPPLPLSALAKESFQYIVMLGGDTEQLDGTWALYTPQMANDLLQRLPSKAPILILNGPRTGKYQSVQPLVENKEAHRTQTDPLTGFVQEQARGRPWSVIDFKFGPEGQPPLSYWGSALKYCLEHPETILVLPGESTSMISEALSLGLHPAIFVHSAMTAPSRRYVAHLVKRGQATLFPAIPTQRHQDPVPLQEPIVVEKLKTVVSR